MLTLTLMLLLPSCGGGAPSGSSSQTDPDASYEVPEFRDAGYNEEEAEAFKAMYVDMETVDGRLYRFMEKNKLRTADHAEILSPGKKGRSLIVGELYDTQGRLKGDIHVPETIFWCRIPFEVKPGDILRVNIDKGGEEPC
jgi:hypothetical protein